MNEPLPRFLTEEPIGFSAAEFLRMGEAGVFDDMKVELIEGEIQRMNPPMGGHSGRQGSIVGQLWAAVPNPAGRVHGEAGIALGHDTVAACDAALVRESVLEQRLLRPDELLLVVEVAETTTERDLRLKRRLYAAAGIPNYWVVDGRERVTHVFADPAHGTYPEPREVPFGRPLAVPGTTATVTL